MALAMLLALWLDRERASPCIFVPACTHGAYKDWEVGKQVTVSVESRYLIGPTRHLVLR